MDFTKENVASYIAMVGVLSVLAQVSEHIHTRNQASSIAWAYLMTHVAGFVTVSQFP